MNRQVQVATECWVTPFGVDMSPLSVPTDPADPGFSSCHFFRLWCHVTRSILMISFYANTVSHSSLWWYRSLMMKPLINKKSECAIKNNEKVSFNLSWDCFVWLFANIISGNGNEWKPFLFIYVHHSHSHSVYWSITSLLANSNMCMCVCVFK